MKTPKDLSAERRALSFLLRDSLVRRSGGWRFGTARIPDAIVERLVASGKALIDKAEVVLAARTRSEARIRIAIAAADSAAQRELKWAERCIDPQNIRARRINADNHRERAGELRLALAEHVLLDPLVYHPMPDLPQ